MGKRAHSLILGFTVDIIVCTLKSSRRLFYVCCSLRPARFSNTVIAAWEFDLFHFLAYQNSAQSLASMRGGAIDIDDEFLRRAIGAPSLSSGNAMILHFPAKPGTINPEDLIDTQGSKTFLDDMVTALKPVFRGATFKGVISSSLGSQRVFIFDRGIYTVVLADRAIDIPEHLSLVPENKRPPLNEVIFEAYQEWFPGWPVAVCCFNNTQLAKSEPLLWRYRPRNPNMFFLPGLDSHTGAPPNLREDVYVDHWLIASSKLLGPNSDGLSKDVRYDRVTPSVRALLPTFVTGRSMTGDYPNGDFVAIRDDVSRGVPDFRRAAPDQLRQIFS